MIFARVKTFNQIFVLIVLISASALFPDIIFPATLIGNELVLTDKINASSPGKYVDYLEDAGGKLSIDDVCSDSLKNNFKRNDSENVNFGFTRSAYWLRFKFLYESAKYKHEEWLLEIAYPLLNHIDVFLVTDEGVLEKISTGRSMPYNERVLKNRKFILPFNLESGTHYAVLLRIQTDGSMSVPLAFRTSSALTEMVKDEQFFFRLYYGILLVMAIFNLFLFTTLKNIDYLIYVIYVVSWGLFQLALNGLDVEYLWQNAPWWSMHAVPVIGSFSAIAMNLFAQQFLQTKKNTPALDKILKIFVVVFVLNIPISMLLEYRISIQILSGVSFFGSFNMIGAGILCWTRGYRPARFYVVSWIAFAMGIIILTMKNFGILPDTSITNYSIQIGSALEVILMSFALADRFRIIQKEKETIQREAFNEQLKMTNSFSRFVPKEFLSLLKKESIVNVALGDQTLQEMPVLFTDIRSYTSLSEKMTPQENIDFLNIHLANIVPIIKKHNGFIDKYIGDAIMALFPGGVNDALSAAVEMQQKVNEFNIAGSTSGKDAIRIGIGIHIGKLMLGTIGQEDRLETTVISDAVNIASRLESLNKKFNTGIIISDDVYKKLDAPDQFNIKKIGLVRIRGKENPVSILEVAVSGCCFKEI